MDVIMLSAQNLEMLVDFEERARVSEPDIFIDEFDRDKLKSKTLESLKNPHFTSARCMMCVDEKGLVIGRLDFAMISSFAFGGDVRVYVDWVYVLKECRHRGVAQFLFEKMEGYLKENGINEYFLWMAENEEAQRFYRNFKGAVIERQDTLTKRL